jgi:hypothetical protein
MDPSSLAAAASKVAASLQKWADAEAGSKKHDKRMKKAMSALAVEGSDLIRAAAAAQQAAATGAAGNATPAGEGEGAGQGTGNGGNESAKTVAVDSSSQGVGMQEGQGGAAEESEPASQKKKKKKKKAAQKVKQEGVVLEAKPWVPYESRTAVLLGRPVAVA